MHRPIASIGSLSLALSLPEKLILNIAQKSQELYREVPQKKKDGTLRITYDARKPLKLIHEQINKKILRKIKFPPYLHGGIRDRNNPRSPFSNAAAHSNSKILILEDIRDFFPSVTVRNVFDIWCRKLRFSPEVAEMLTLLTTYQEVVPQGAKTSSYLTNLAFWDIEASLVTRLQNLGLSYSRFVDDICVSSTSNITLETKTEAIRLIYGMLAAKGFKPKRSKHQILKAGQRMEVTGLVVNGSRPTISKPERKRIRAAVHSLHKAVSYGGIDDQTLHQYRSASGRVGRLTICGCSESSSLKSMLDEISSILNKRDSSPISETPVIYSENLSEQVPW